jgi:hypothetical protein
VPCNVTVCNIRAGDIKINGELHFQCSIAFGKLVNVQYYFHLRIQILSDIFLYFLTVYSSMSCIKYR